MAWHGAHRFEHPNVSDAACPNLLLHHSRAGFSQIVHVR